MHKPSANPWFSLSSPTGVSLSASSFAWVLPGTWYLLKRISGFCSVLLDSFASFALFGVRPIWFLAFWSPSVTGFVCLGVFSFLGGLVLRSACSFTGFFPGILGRVGAGFRIFVLGPGVLSLWGCFGFWWWCRVPCWLLLTEEFHLYIFESTAVTQATPPHLF